MVTTDWFMALNKVIKVILKDVVGLHFTNLTSATDCEQMRSE